MAKTVPSLLAVALAAFPLGPLSAATPFPAGYDAAYRAYVASLPPAGRGAVWLTRLEGVASEPRPMKLRGVPMVYLFSCKAHYCDTDQVNIFLAPDRKTFRAVLKMSGVERLLGGAGPAEGICVRRIQDSGGTLENC